MFYLILGFLCILPFSCFLFPRIDIWHAQGHFAQISILILFASSFFLKSNPIKIKNISLGILILWSGLLTWYLQYQSMLKNTYATWQFFPFFNFLCLILFYWICVQYLDREKIGKILKWFSYSILVMVFYCVLQAFRLDQFMKVFKDLPYPVVRPAVVGTIGNPTHLSGYLGMCLPLFFGKRPFNILSMILIWIILLFYTNFGDSVAPIAISGIIVGLSTTGYYLWKTNRKFFIIFSLVIFIVVGFLFLTSSNKKDLINDSGRIGYWLYYFNLSKDSFITGQGLVAVNIIAKQGNIYKDVRHLHNEFFHFTLELGLIGLLAIVYCVWEYFKIRIGEDKTSLILRTMFLGFLINCLIVYPAHLWVVSILAMFVYAGINCIKNKELLWLEH